MALQFPQRVNYMDPAKVHRDVQQTEWNALRNEGLRDQIDQRNQVFDANQMYDNAKWLAAATKYGMTLDPKSARNNFPSFWEEGARRGLWSAEGVQTPDGETMSLNDIMMQDESEFMQGFSRLHEQAKMMMSGGRPGADLETQQQLPAKIQQANWWLRASPEERLGYMSANYAGSVREIGGVPHWVMPGGETVPLSSMEDEVAGANQLAMATGEGGRGRAPGPGGYQVVPGTQADIEAQERLDEEEAERKKAEKAALMKSIQSQTVVEDVERLNEQIIAGTVPFGREAAAQEMLAPALQSDGYRNAIALIKSVEGNVGVDSLLRIKQSGAGLGQVPQTQLNLLSRLLGELTLTQSEAQFRDTWNRMGRVYQSIWDAADEEMIALGAVPPEVILNLNIVKRAPPEALQHLQNNPDTIADFEAYYGYRPAGFE